MSDISYNIIKASVGSSQISKAMFLYVEGVERPIRGIVEIARH